MNLPEIFTQYEKTKKINTIYSYLKLYPHLYTELKIETSYLDTHYFRKEMSQRAYHYYHNLENIPMDESGKCYRFISFEEGYSDKKLEGFKLKMITGEQIDILLKTSDTAMRSVGKNKKIKDRLFDITAYLDEYNPTIKARLMYFRNSKSNIPIVNSKGILFTNDKFSFYAIKNKFNFIEDFILMTDEEKREIIKKDVLAFNSRLNGEELTRRYLNDSKFYLDYIKYVSGSKLKAAYDFVSNISSSVLCKCCQKEECVFSDYLIQYSEVCSQKCSNTYINFIHKRLSNNSSNTYKTNIGKNENKILEILKGHVENLKSCKTSFRLGPYICDALINDNLVVEINEKHHLYGKFIKKDKEKYKYILSRGYRLLIVWDTVPQKVATKDKIRELTTGYLSMGEVAVAYHTPTEKDKIRIITNSGIVKFSAITDNGVKKCKEIKTAGGKTLICSYNHKLFFNGESKKVVDINCGEMVDTVDGPEKIISIVDCGEHKVYDVVGSDDMSYISNGFLSHNCLILDEIAFVDEHLLSEFWSSVFPIISSSKKSKVFMCSTPNGTGNLFHKIYTGAVEKSNGWEHDLILWNEVPGRTEKWANEIRAGLASDETFDQEFNCKFINTGTSSINEQVYERLKKEIKEPVEILMEGKYKIWEHPDASRIYVAGVDVSEGVGGDYSVIKVLDITDLNEIIEVAEYYDNTIPVAEFSNKLYEILQHWGNPLVCIERNNQGGQVADRLGMDYGYPKVVNWGSKLAGRKSLELFGMISSRNTKYYACANARYYYSDKGAVVFRNDASLEEIFKDFVKLPNDTWGAISGKHDDRTMATIWALMILDKDLCERWFTIEEFDTCGKPSKISPLDYGIQYFERATSIYTNEQVSRIEQSRIAPMVFGSMGEMDCEISQLKADGWHLLGGSMPHIDPSRTFNDSQWESYERLF